MNTSNTASVATAASRFSTANILLAIGFISSAVAWWLIAFPVSTFSNIDKHADHFPTVFLHMIGGTIMLFLGLANLYTGTTGKQFKYHKTIGRTYLIGGSVGAIAAIGLTLSPFHKSAGAGIFTNTSVSLVTLASSWLIAAAMAYRAVRNGRYDAHRDWVIRSYILAWSFVFCRIASRVPGIGELGGGEAFIWLSWVAPLIICEFALQWRNGSKLAPKRPVVSV
jgi:uncharacterized membrane protein YozB (DUF420 family)